MTAHCGFNLSNFNIYTLKHKCSSNKDNNQLVKYTFMILVACYFSRGRLFGRTNVRIIKERATAKISRNIPRWPQISGEFTKTCKLGICVFSTMMMIERYCKSLNYLLCSLSVKFVVN